LRLWGRGSSINVQKVLWTLQELDLHFEHVEVGGRFGRLDAPGFLAMNPHGRIPVLEDGGGAIWESNAIVRYLCARYSSGDLCCEDLAERAAQDQWMDWTATTLQPAFIGFFWNWYRTPEARRDAKRCADLLASAHDAFAVLDKALPERALGRPATGDIPMATLLYRYFTLEIDRPPLPRLEAWYADLCARPAYRTAVMRPYDELKGRLAF